MLRPEAKVMPILSEKTRRNVMNPARVEIPNRIYNDVTVIRIVTVALTRMCIRKKTKLR